LDFRPVDLGAPLQVALHSSCSARRELGVADAARDLLDRLANVQALEPDHAYKDAQKLTVAARHLLREKFRGAIAGLTGVNFAVAETGTLCLVENEGNGRMCSTAPDVHIAVTGIEKVIARLDQLPPLLTLLTRSATGQAITTYVNMIGPRLLSLVPPIHFVLLDATEICSTFHELLRKQAWAVGMPTNALLISGPSKSADIEQTLTYGVHGPKELIVLLR